MTREECKKVIAVLRANYSNFAVTNQTQFEVWVKFLEDIDYSLADKAVQKIIMESEFPPTIATIRKQCLSITGHKKKSKADCIGLINKAISKFGRYQVVEAMDWIKEQDEATYHVIKAIGLTNYCNSDPNFSNNLIIKMYSEIADSKEKQMLLTQEFTEQIAEIRLNASKMIAIEG